MTARTPVSSTEAGYVDPLRGLYTGVITAGQDVLTNGTKSNLRNNYITEIYYFDASESVVDNDTWASGISGIKAVFTQCDEGQSTADAVSAHLDTAAGLIRFKVEQAETPSFWLLLFIDPSVGRRSGYPGR